MTAAPLDPIPGPLQGILQQSLQTLRLEWDPQAACIRLNLRVHPIQCYSLKALNEIKRVMDAIDASAGKVRTFVLSSDVPGVFNFGGDLALFVLLARARDLESLKMYGRACIDLLWWLETAADRGVFTIGLVQGDCLGGGLESILPLHRVICERPVNAGYPEVLFNLFPGMGAWSFGARKSGVTAAAEMILSGRIHTADELRALGLADVVVDQHEGEAALASMLRSIEPYSRGMLAALRARRMASPINRDSLLQIVDHWAETALQLTDRDLRLMERLARAQIRKLGGAATGTIEEIKRIELEHAWQVNNAGTPLDRRSGLSTTA
jgi:DSF synthase